MRSASTTPPSEPRQRLAAMKAMLSKLLAYFPGAPVRGPATIDLWAAELMDFEVSVVEEAVAEIGCRAEKFPSLARILEESRETVRRRTPPVPPPAPEKALPRPCTYPLGTLVKWPVRNGILHGLCTARLSPECASRAGLWPIGRLREALSIHRTGACASCVQARVGAR